MRGLPTVRLSSEEPRPVNLVIQRWGDVTLWRGADNELVVTVRNRWGRGPNHLVVEGPGGQVMSRAFCGQNGISGREFWYDAPDEVTCEKCKRWVLFFANHTIPEALGMKDVPDARERYAGDDMKKKVAP